MLFLGASKRVSLLERFVEAACRHGIDLKMLSCEADERFYPISSLAQVIGAPAFLSVDFGGWLGGVIERHSVDIVIPNMDSATVALSRFAETYRGSCWLLVSTRLLCETMYDKILADAFFHRCGLPLPSNTAGRFPKILKPRFGFGSRNVHIASNAAKMDELQQDSECEYLVQDFLSGCQETTADIYLSHRYGLLGYVLRDRIEVSDGEVMVCRTRFPRIGEERLLETVASISGWQGCITLQYLTASGKDLYVLEINPRFGGGATCGMEAGLDMASYILLERLSRPIVRPKAMRNLMMTRARRDFFRELEESSFC
jgi:carbamoyl-phosphate synthase large subunit